MNRAFIAERPHSFLLGQKKCPLFIQSRFGFFWVGSLRVRQATLNIVHPQLSVGAVLSTEIVHPFGRLELRAKGDSLIHSNYDQNLNTWKQMHIAQQYKVLKWSTGTACVSKNRAFMQLYGMKLLELAKKRSGTIQKALEIFQFLLSLISSLRFFSFKICWWMSDSLFTFLFGKCDVWKHHSNEKKCLFLY